LPSLAGVVVNGTTQHETVAPPAADATMESAVIVDALAHMAPIASMQSCTPADCAPSTEQSGPHVDASKRGDAHGSTSDTEPSTNACAIVSHEVLQPADNEGDGGASWSATPHRAEEGSPDVGREACGTVSQLRDAEGGSLMAREQCQDSAALVASSDNPHGNLMHRKAIRLAFGEVQSDRDEQGAVEEVLDESTSLGVALLVSLQQSR